MIHRRLALAAFAAALVWISRPAAANDHLTGIVLMSASAHTIVVHHAAFAGMPAMTMTFAVPAGTHVEPGERITADVDRTREPWVLSHIRAVGETASSNVRALTLLKVGDRVPGGAFLDQTGRRFTLDDLTGAPYALSFVYTRCADLKMCPLISAKYRSLQARTRKPVGLVEISLDPGYDRSPVLARYAAGFGADPARWHLLTGDPRRVLDFAARFGILEHAAGAVTIVHSERLAIVDRAGRIAKLYDNANWSTDDVAAELRKLR